jgi:hypothetical protein
MEKEHGRIVMRGMGGFLNPPTHPEHNQSVQSARGDTFSLSLSTAVECEWLNDATRTTARTVLAAWKRPPLDSPEVQEWILQVLGYFRGCYKGEGPEPQCWHADRLRILKSGDDARPNEEHAGIHLIRQYYPEYEPTGEHFAAAYWGTKPQAVA